MTLNDLKNGESGYITAVAGEGMLRRRLLEMGLTPNTKITLKKSAPLGDPIWICLRGYELSLRKEEAKNINIREIKNDLCGGCKKCCE